MASSNLPYDALGLEIPPASEARLDLFLAPGLELSRLPHSPLLPLKRSEHIFTQRRLPSPPGKGVSPVILATNSQRRCRPQLHVSSHLDFMQELGRQRFQYLECMSLNIGLKFPRILHDADEGVAGFPVRELRREHPVSDFRCRVLAYCIGG